jgi:tetratricopeptide (TPR) repeat protein
VTLCVAFGSDPFNEIERMTMLRFILAAWLLSLSAAGAVLAGDAASSIQAGEAKLKAGQIDGGLALFREAVQADPDSALAHTRLGGALLLKQEYTASIEEFRVAIKLDASNADAFVGIAVAYLHGDDYALARASLEEAKRLAPTKQAKIDELIAHIDQRASGGSAPPAH